MLTESQARLARLVQDGRWNVRMSVGVHPDATPELLRWVRVQVARNPSTPVEALCLLAGDVDATVRYGVTRNPNVPPEILTALSQDDVDLVRLGVAKNPSTPRVSG